MSTEAQKAFDELWEACADPDTLVGQGWRLMGAQIAALEPHPHPLLALYVALKTKR